MKPYPYYTADVFTDRIFAGNPLAVVPDGRGLKDAQMQAIAREFNLSETVFALPPTDTAHTRRLRIFTPQAELPFAGHPTLGAAHVLAETGAVPLVDEDTRIIFEEGVGPVEVTLRRVDGKPSFARLSVARMPEVGPPPPAVDALAAMLGLAPGDVLDDPAPQAVSCGVPFLFIALRTLDAVARARLDPGRWSSLLSRFWAPHVYVLSFETVEPDTQVHARMFGPGFGIDEDPATGAAAAALAGYLGGRTPTAGGDLRWVVEQGYEMGRPSILSVEAETMDGAITAVRVGGASVMVSRGEIMMPS